MEQWANEAVCAALRELGAASQVPLAVTGISRDGTSPPSLVIDVELRYLCATPVCCGEPGCYIGFLGARRLEVPSAVAGALKLTAPPQVTIRAALTYEPGYRHTALDYGPQSSCTLTYDPAHFGY